MMTVVAAITLVAGCGSSESKAKDTTAAATTPAGTDGASNATNAPAGGGSSNDAVQLGVQNATYGTGRLHVEFAGDIGGAAEVDGTGIVTNGFANFDFTDTNRGLAVVFAFGGDQGSVASFTWDNITAGGTFGKECSIDFTKADSTALEATFTCTHMPGVASSSTDEKSVDAKGSFQMAAG